MTPLPYGRQLIEDDDVAAVVAALRSDFLAHGPRVAAFERAFAAAVGAGEAVACSSGTAALQLALAGLDVGPGDTCVVPAITFLSTATAARLLGAAVAFADVDAETGLITPVTLDEALGRTPRARVALPVHLAGRLADMAGLARIAAAHGCRLVEDACHAVGGTDAEGRPAGACAHSEAAAFSFHPVKTLAAGEGGMVTLNDLARAERLRRLRNHGVTRDPALASAPLEPWAYEQLELGFNLRMDEMSAALGLSQLAKLSRFAGRRRALAARYGELLAPLAPQVRPAPTPPGQHPCLHLYTVLIDFERLGTDRATVMRRMGAAGIATQVHYIPLYRQPPLRRRMSRQGGAPDSLPGAEAYYARVLALPLFPAMEDSDPERVVAALAEAIGA